MNNSISFSGLLYAKNIHHTSKPIICCHHGDAKFVKLLSEASKKNSQTFFDKNIFSFYEKEGVIYVKIETKEIPTFNFFEKFLFNISSLQKKALESRKNNLFTELVFHLNKFEYEYLKENYLFISKKQLKLFENFLIKNAKESEKELAEYFFKN